MKNSGPKPSTLGKTAFLEEVAEAVLSEKYPEKCAVVLPSFRARAAFYRACSRVAKKTSRLPQAFTLSGFVVKDEKRKIIDPLETLAVLYEVQLKSKDCTTEFNNFLGWGPVALADFNEIDLKCLDAQKVFKNLKDIKDIEDWSFAKDEWSEDQTRFSKQWDRLAPLYLELHAELEKRGHTTQAMAMRSQSESSSTNCFDKVFAVGLTAINEAQKRHLKKWSHSGKLNMMWDGDNSYVEDEQIEAGYFIRNFEGDKNIKLPNRLAHDQPILNAVDCSSVLSACQYIREHVLKMSDDEKGRTVIVVPDQASLPVLLQSLPKCDEGYNVTMGMSLRETSVFPFINLVCRINARENSNWHYEELMSVLNQPVILKAYKKTGFEKDASQVLRKLAEKHVVWVSEENIYEFSDGAVYKFVMELRTMSVKGADEYLSAFVVWANELNEKLSSSSDPWIKAGWNCVRKSVAMVVRLQKTQTPCSTAHDVRSILTRLLATQKIDLLGEPAKGLQIMGLNETRALDYDNIFILDCNEGVLPKHEIPDSFIPLDLKLALKMPGRYEKEAAYAYSFYRLLNRSSKIHFLYKSEGRTNDGTEASRYILQLKSTFKPGGKKLKITDIKYSMPLPGARPDIPPLYLSDDMRVQLKLWSEKGMSPSAINKMVSCERNFAYRYLLKLQEQKDLQENMESNTIGSIVHFVFEKGLKDVIGSKLTTEHLDSILKNLDVLLERATEKYYNTNMVKNGENLLLLESARSTIQKLIRKEISELNSAASEEIILKGIEKKLSAEYPRDDGGSIAFFGLADKLEIADGITRVVDYKTGMTKKSDLKLKGDFEEDLDSGKKSKAIQLLVYCSMLLNDNTRSVSAGIRSGRNAKSGLLSLEIDGSDKITIESVEKLIKWIQKKIDILSENEHEVHHNHDSSFCEYCAVLDPVKKFWA